MAAKRKQSGFSHEFLQTLMALTKDSTLLMVGTVQSRTKLTGTNPKTGAWEIYRVEVRGIDGRTGMATVSDPAGIPAVGEHVVLPVFVGSNGYLREAKQLEAALW